MNNLQSQANKEKREHGQENKKTIETLMTSLQQDGIISSFEKNVHVQKHGFKHPFQYKADYLIQTFDGKYIVVRSTTSHKDRVKIYNHDIEGILGNAEYSTNIVASVYLLPNDQLENKNFLSFQDRIRKNIEYSPFTHCLVHNQFKEFLENLQSSTIEKIESLHEDPFVYEKRPLTGSEFAKQGISFEQAIVRILNTEGELQKYRHGTSDKITARILDHFSATYGVTKPDIHHIHASDTITHLRSGGQSKSDFLVTLETGKGKFIETFSAKNTTRSIVSCHEYDYNRFAKVLNCEGSKLEEYLRLFQEHGGYQSLVTNLPEQSSLQEFKKLLSEKKSVLAEWVISGKHDNDNIVDSTTQIAKHLIIKQNDKISCLTVQKYIEQLDNNIKTNDSTLGTYFGWTYPSKRKGKKIQLKIPVLI